MLYSALHNAVVYKTDVPARIVGCVAGARQVANDTVAVPCTLEAMQLMRVLGYAALSPILTSYDWPGRFRPFDHQRHMAAFITLHPRSFNLSDMGTGKTLSTLWAYDYLMRMGLVRKVLILSPLSTLYRVWEEEIFTHFLGRRKAVVVYGSREKRMEKLRQEADFYILNHDGLGLGATRGTTGLQLGELGKFIRDSIDFNAVIVDEGSVYKDPSTMRSKVLRSVSFNKDWMTWLTGTPVPVCPTNAWSQARIVRKDYNESYRSFHDRVLTKITTFKYAPKPGSHKMAADILQPAIRFNRDDCLDLPEVMLQTRDVALSKEQTAAMADLKKQLKVEIGRGQITAINEASLRLKMIQIVCGAVYDSNHVAHMIDAKPRIDELLDVCEQASHKILIFAPLTSVVNVLYSELKKHYTVEKVNGEVGASKRNEIFRAFQQDKSPRIIVADPGCMAHGLTLTQADTTVWYAPTDKPEVYQQANKRMDRPGQKNRMLIVRLAATPIEREMYRRLDSRDSMQGLVMDLIKGE